MKSLGKDRETPDQQREFLHSIALDFQDIVNTGLDAQYARHKIFIENNSLRLATVNVAFSEHFSKDVSENGHTVSFRPETKKLRNSEALANSSHYTEIPGLPKQAVKAMLGDWPLDSESYPKDSKKSKIGIGTPRRRSRVMLKNGFRSSTRQ